MNARIVVAYRDDYPEYRTDARLIQDKKTPGHCWPGVFLFGCVAGGNPTNSAAVQSAAVLQPSSTRDDKTIQIKLRRRESRQNQPAQNSQASLPHQTMTLTIAEAVQRDKKLPQKAKIGIQQRVQDLANMIGSLPVRWTSVPTFTIKLRSQSTHHSMINASCNTASGQAI